MIQREKKIAGKEGERERGGGQKRERIPQRKKHYTSHNRDFVILEKIKQAKSGANRERLAWEPASGKDGGGRWTLEITQRISLFG